MKTSQFKVLAVALISVWANAVLADNTPISQTESTLSNRMSKKLGAFAAVAQPSPTLLGMNVAYNVTDYLRATAGYGSLSVGFGSFEASATTLGVGANAYVPGWSLTPTVGLHFGTVSYSGDATLSVGGFTESGSHIYTNIGFDWQAKNGFNAGGGYQFSLKSGINPGMYVHAGWFFDLLS